jgi:hypothetical protein
MQKIFVVVVNTALEIEQVEAGRKRPSWTQAIVWRAGCTGQNPNFSLARSLPATRPPRPPQDPATMTTKGALPPRLPQRSPLTASSFLCLLMSPSFTAGSRVQAPPLAQNSA